jgi:hypothetical protein
MDFSVKKTGAANLLAVFFLNSLWSSVKIHIQAQHAHSACECANKINLNSQSECSIIIALVDTWRSGISISLLLSTLGKNMAGIVVSLTILLLFLSELLP